MTIKFNKYNVTDGTTKARCSYTIDGRWDGRKVVTIYAKDFGRTMTAIFENARNDSDTQQDVFRTDTMDIFEGDPMFPAARAAAMRHGYNNARR